MIDIKTTDKGRRVLYTLLGVALLLVAFWVSVFAMQNAARAEATVINVTTTVDEDSDPGDGCSLYEAVVAANTAAAYGGCTAGDAEGPNTIVLPAGTFSRDADSGPLEDSNLELNNVSLVGQGYEETVIAGYTLNLSGSQAASLEDLSITMPISYSADTRLLIDGSNKTVSGVEISNDGMNSTYITLSPNGGTVSDTQIIDTSMLTSVSTVPASILSCATDDACDTLLLSNFNMASQFSTTASLANVDSVSVQDSNFTAITANSATLIVGANGLIDNVDISGPNNAGFTAGDGATIADLSVVNTVGGGNSITLGEGTSVDGLTQTGGNISLNGAATNLHNVSQSSVNGVVTLYIDAEELIDYSGSSSSVVDIDASTIMQNISMEAPSVLIDGSASSIDNLTMAGSSVASFSNDQANADLSGIYIEYTGADNSHPAVNIAGDGVILNDFSVIRTQDGEGAAQGNLNFEGTSVTINDLWLMNSYLTGENIDTFNLSNFTAEGPSHLPAIYISGDVSDVSISNGYITGSRDGISVSADNLTGGNVTIQNVQFEDVIGDEETYTSAIYTDSVENVTIRDVTIDSSLVGVSLTDGNSYEIANVSIVNTGIGLLAAAGGATDAATLNINNSTLFALESGVPVNPTTAVGGAGAMLIAGLSADINTNVSNSLIGGDGVYDDCSASVAINFTNSFATDSSCTGATQYEDFSSVVETSLADNGSENDLIGYDGSFGNLHTLALLSSSPAIGFGDSDTCEDVDARGFSRPANPGCDIGAFQFNTVAYVPPEDEEEDDDEEETPTSEESNDDENNGAGGSSGNSSSSQTGASTTNSTSDDDSSTSSSDDPSTPNTGKDESTDNNRLQANSESNQEEWLVLNLILMIAGATLAIIVITWVIRRFFASKPNGTM